MGNHIAAFVTKPALNCIKKMAVVGKLPELMIKNKANY